MTHRPEPLIPDLPLLHRGKVRELYALPDRPDLLVMVATDAISAFDFVLSPAVPDKGAVLTQLSRWWFEQVGDIVPNHQVDDAGTWPMDEQLARRAILAERLEMVPVECVARGYLTGSGWAEYQANGTVTGIELPAGLHDGSPLPEPIFTPATKAEQGEHDENITFEQLVERVGAPLAEELRELTLALYRRAASIAWTRGLVLADTKFEFGRRRDGTLVLADEILTPDSSRYWDADAYARGELVSFDKQYLRNWLTEESGWDRASDQAPPPLPDAVVQATRQRYLEAYQLLTGSRFETGDDHVRTDRVAPMATVVVDVMPRPEILDPQGKAVTGALERLGHHGLSVRQGKRFEISVEGEVTDQVLAQVREAAETLLANTVIEQFTVRVEQ